MKYYDSMNISENLNCEYFEDFYLGEKTQQAVAIGIKQRHITLYQWNVETVNIFAGIYIGEGSKKASKQAVRILQAIMPVKFVAGDHCCVSLLNVGDYFGNIYIREYFAKRLLCHWNVWTVNIFPWFVMIETLNSEQKWSF